MSTALDDIRQLDEAPAWAMPTPSRTATMPFVYGYLRTAVDRPRFVQRCHDELLAWCQREGWHLGGIFTDIGVESETVWRDGFTNLLDAASHPGVFGVAVLHGSHLSSHPDTARWLVSQIRSSGVALLVRHGGLPESAARLCDGHTVATTA